MKTADVLRKWETYAYRLAFHITREEKRAAELAGEALLSASFRLAGTASESKAQAVVKRAVLQKAVAAICACLEEEAAEETCGRPTAATKNGSPN